MFVVCGRHFSTLLLFYYLYSVDVRPPCFPQSVPAGAGALRPPLQSECVARLLGCQAAGSTLRRRREARYWLVRSQPNSMLLCSHTNWHPGTHCNLLSWIRCAVAAVASFSRRNTPGSYGEREERRWRYVVVPGSGLVWPPPARHVSQLVREERSEESPGLLSVAELGWTRQLQTEWQWGDRRPGQISTRWMS